MFSQEALTRKDLAQHCVLKAQPYKPVCAWQLSPIETVLLPYEWHNATLADGHQHRHARELVRALSLSVRAQIPLLIRVPINLHPG